MRVFYHILGNNLAVTLANFFVWFAVIFWGYLETGSVLITSISGGAFMAAAALSGIWFGSIVDHNRKKTVMMISSVVTLTAFAAALAIYVSVPDGTFSSVGNPWLWVFVFVILFGVLAANLRNIAMVTLVRMLVPEEKRPHMNGLSGMVMGISSSGAGIGSGFMLAYSDLLWVLIAGLTVGVLAFIHLVFFIRIPEQKIVHTEDAPKRIDLRGTFAVVIAIPGLLALIFFTTFNNFLGGVFMALLDPYGLSMMPVQAWGVMWGVLSFGFIFGGLFIARYGLGKNPVRTLFLVNIGMWLMAIIFPSQPSIILLAIGILSWTCLVPFVEASEHTVIQKIVPPERQGRVIGFAQSIETGAAPITAFLIGPLAQFVFIPFMTTGSGVGLIGDWFGVGPGRGMALVFMFAASIGLIVTLIAMRSNAFKLLAKRYSDG